MALTKFGFLVTGSGLCPQTDQMVMRSADFEMTIVGMADAAHGADVACALVAQGVELIELCGGFGPKWTAQIIDAIEGAVPVGSVGYGPESIDAMYRLFAPS